MAEIKSEDFSTLWQLIDGYYTARGLKHPDFDDAMKWAHTEMGEVYEIDLYSKGYIRNNPKDKEKYANASIGEELGDVIMMLMVAGIRKGEDPLLCLIEKITRKIREAENGQVPEIRLG